MKNKINIALIGIGGRMGLAILELIDEHNSKVNLKIKAQENDDQEIEVVFGLEISKNQGLVKNKGIPLYENLAAVPEASLSGLDLVVDFSSPQGTIQALEYSLKKNLKLAFVIGTTGFSAEQESKLNEISQTLPIVLSGNFSLGINVLIKLIKIALPTLAGDYDVEIVEHHHNQKKDAPSGTAKMLLRAVQEIGDFKNYAIVTERNGQIGKRGNREIGIFALRGGGVIGEHKIYFFSENDKLELTHTAFNRKAFTSGVLKAIHFLASEKPPNKIQNKTQKPRAGLFNLQDILEG